MSRKPHRAYENDGKETNKERSLRKALKDRDNEIRRLKSELKTLNEAFKKSANYMSTKSKKLSVEDLINAANKEQSLEETMKSVGTCVNCGSHDIFRGKVPSGTLVLCRNCNHREVLTHEQEEDL